VYLYFVNLCVVYFCFIHFLCLFLCLFLFFDSAIPAYLFEKALNNLLRQTSESVGEESVPLIFLLCHHPFVSSSVVFKPIHQWRKIGVFLICCVMVFCSFMLPSSCSCFRFVVLEKLVEQEKEKVEDFLLKRMADPELNTSEKEATMSTIATFLAHWGAKSG
jgi:hypothetical protein